MREESRVPEYKPGTVDDVELMELGFDGEQIDMKIPLWMKGTLHMRNHAIAAAKEATMREMEQKRKQEEPRRTGRPRGRMAASRRRH